jgi:inosine triphosphate pyrophosphatase
MALFFITGSNKKVAEIKAHIPTIEQLDIELPEIQGLDPHKILAAKLLEARKHYGNEYIVEDTSLYFDGMNGLPGPLIKWFVEALGLEGLATLAAGYTGKAVAKTLIGYADERGAVEFFEGEMHGTIVPPRGEGYGWDAIFVPDGYDKTLAELGVEEKNALSMRAKAAQKLKHYLDARA